MDKRLLDKKVIVTGGSRGIGAGIVERLFNEGAEIIIADIKKDLANLKGFKHQNLINISNIVGKHTYV